MKLADLIETSSLLPSLEILGIAEDSRQVMKGFVFFALDGKITNGSLYIKDAVKRGATAIISEKGKKIPDVGVPVIYVENTRHVLAIAAARFYNKQPNTVVAVTGTSGKTSVVSFLRDIWLQAGFSAASIGTLGVIFPKNIKSVKSGSITTPGPVSLHQTLFKIVKNEITHVAMEASSHGINQCRLDGVNFSAVGFTNIGRDHIDYHVTLENYFNAKMRIFENLLPKASPAVVYADNFYSNQVITRIRQAGRSVFTVGRNGQFIVLKQIEQIKHGQKLKIFHKNKNYDVIFPLFGEFQVANALLAAGLALVTEKIPPAIIFESIRFLSGTIGRFEYVGTTKNGAQIYIDYAHKPEALENVLKEIHSFTEGRVVLVFGCGGDRDHGKRAMMGKIAKKWADIVIVTDDNPRTEDAQKIRNQILVSIPEAIEEADRRVAIEIAISLLKKGDTLLVAGKGHEKEQIIGCKIFPFSDREEIIMLLQRGIK